MQEIIANPTPEQRAEVLGWLSVPYRESKQIASGFDEDRIHCIAESGEMIGFALFTVEGTESAIDVFEVHPSHRRRGAGKGLVTHMLKHLRSCGATSVEVDCSPRDSETFWLANGFEPVDGERQQDDPIFLRKSLCE